MIRSRIKPGLPAFIAALLLGAGGLAGCAMEDFDSVPYAWEEGYAPPPEIHDDEIWPGPDNGLYDDDFGPGFNGLYEEDIGPGFD